MLELVLLLVSVASMAHADQRAGTAATKPHLIMALTDDLGWNYPGYHNPEVISPTLDQLANEGFRTGIIATDDSHDVPADGFGGWVMVAAEALEAGAIIKALKAGDYFASCGPAFTSIRLDGNMLHVTCSPVDRIVVAAGGHRSFATGGDGMTEARIEISSTDFEFFRVVLTDRAGKQAWSNHYWMDDLGLR